MPDCKQDIGRKQKFDSITPDWTSVWTPDQAEKELENFKWQGAGWYINKSDTLLVTPFGDDGHFFKFNVYNGRNPAEDFNWVVNAPVRKDYR